MVQKPFLDPVSLPINGTDKLTAQDETRAAITQQAVRKKESSLHIRFKDYVLTNLQALHLSSKVQFETRRPKNGFLTFLTFYTLCGSLDTKVQ